MPSLKDLRNRIASVKSTQKITKAMQMVAVAKLRRAQARGRGGATLCRADRDGAVQSRRRLERRDAGAPAADRHRRRADASSSRLHRRARPLRRLQHLDRASGARPGQCAASRKARRSRSSASARRATTSFAATSKSRSSTWSICAPCARSAMPTRSRSPARCSSCSRRGEFDVCTLFYARFKSVIAQIPTAQQLIPPEFAKTDEDAPAYDYEPDEGEILEQLAAAARSRCASIARCSKTWRPSSARR